MGVPVSDCDRHTCFFAHISTQRRLSAARTGKYNWVGDLVCWKINCKFVLLKC